MRVGSSESNPKNEVSVSFALIKIQLPSDSEWMFPLSCRNSEQLGPTGCTNIDSSLELGANENPMNSYVLKNPFPTTAKKNISRSQISDEADKKDQTRRRKKNRKEHSTRMIERKNGVETKKAD
ncbi:unnamed protein product [Sphenostylis stenocarpa]|uniref:Uncharacterized protein n=1 Tax=Sphenostylis stenocarpa TaxID=92480 RepID=A0AA86VXU0_9FABA|nr:unnamed protein product [Sphenostylis stenocarpa]